MQITGRNHLAADPATAWAAFHDAGVLERTLPGAQSVQQVEPGRYAITVSAGVAAIKGTYEGHASFSEETEPESFVLSLSGSGGPGTVDADVRVDLSPSDEGGTTLDWTADAVVGGAVGGVGQRMLSSVAKRLATQFFGNIERDIAGGGATHEGTGPTEADPAASGSGEEAGMPSAVAVRSTPVTAARAPGAGGAGGSEAAAQMAPMLAGAAIALVGVALGARLRRRP